MSETSYDSRPETLEHIRRVQILLSEVESNLRQRAILHDKSKVESPEVEVFDRVTPKLRELTYGSDEYKASLEEMGDALHHHYNHNSHHPEYWAFDEYGNLWKDQVQSGRAIRSMSLLDLIEMLVDWKAATERHDDGNIERSIKQNQERFGYSDDLRNVFDNTRRELGWSKKPDSEDVRLARLKGEFMYELSRGSYKESPSEDVS